MNNQYPELMSEYSRRKVLEEMDSIHLEQEALKGQKPQRRWLTQNLIAVGDWMIQNGEKLRKRADSKPQTALHEYLRETAHKSGA